MCAQSMLAEAITYRQQLSCGDPDHADGPEPDCVACREQRSLALQSMAELGFFPDELVPAQQGGTMRRGA